MRHSEPTPLGTTSTFSGSVFNQRSISFAVLVEIAIARSAALIPLTQYCQTAMLKAGIFASFFNISG